MKTAKDKANELVDKYTESISYYGQHEIEQLQDAIKCAKIAVDEIKNLLPNINNTPPARREPEDRYFKYWHGVKNELNKML